MRSHSRRFTALLAPVVAWCLVATFVMPLSAKPRNKKKRQKETAAARQRREAAARLAAAAGMFRTMPQSLPSMDQSGGVTPTASDGSKVGIGDPKPQKQDPRAEVKEVVKCLFT